VIGKQHQNKLSPIIAAVKSILPLPLVTSVPKPALNKW
jgi:hypothetical protein